MDRRPKANQAAKREKKQLLEAKPTGRDCKETQPNSAHSKSRANQNQRTGGGSQSKGKAPGLGAVDKTRYAKQGRRRLNS